MVEPHGNTRPCDVCSFIDRRWLSLPPKGNQSSIQVHNESPTDVSLPPCFSSLFHVHVVNLNCYRSFDTQAIASCNFNSRLTILQTTHHFCIVQCLQYLWLQIVPKGLYTQAGLTTSSEGPFPQLQQYQYVLSSRGRLVRTSVSCSQPG